MSPVGQLGPSQPRMDLPTSPGDAHAGGGHLGLNSLLLASSLLLTTVIGLHNGLPDSWAAVAGGAHLLAAAYLLSSFRVSGQRITPPSVIAFCVLVFGVWAPALVAGRAVVIAAAAPSPESYVHVGTAALVVLAGLLFTNVIMRTSPGDVGVRPLRYGVQVNPASMLRVGIALELLAVLSFFAYVYVAGLPVSALSILADRAQTPGQYAGGGPQYFLAGIDLSIPGTILIFTSSKMTGRRAQALVTVALVTLAYFNLGFKYRVGVLAIALLVVHLNLQTVAATRKRVRSPRMAVIVAGSVAMVVVLALQFVRGNHELAPLGVHREANVQTFSDITVRQINISTSYAVLHDANLRPLWGASYLELPSLLVPRALLPRKPVPAVIEELQAVTSPGVGAAVPLWAEADQNFGLIGVFVFGALLGVLATRSSRVAFTDPYTVLIVAAMTGVIASCLLRSIMFWAVWQTGAIVGPLLYLRRRQRIGPQR